MIKRFMSADILMLMLLSSNICASKNPKPMEPKPDNPMPGMTSEVFGKEEISLMDQQPDKFYVYLNRDLIDCFNSMPMTEDMPEILCVMREHIKAYKSADYDFACCAVEEALKYCKNPENIDVLLSYKSDLESGKAILSVDPVTRKHHCKSKQCLRLCKLIVRDSIRTCSLAVRQDAAICGNLAVNGNVAVGGNLAVTGNESIGGNLTVTGTINGAPFPTPVNPIISGTTLNISGTSTLGVTTIEGAHPVLDFAESVATIRGVFAMPDLSAFTVTATTTAAGTAATFTFAPAVPNIPAPTLQAGAGFNAAAPGAHITPTGADLSELVGVYSNDTALADAVDYIYINLSFPLVFTKPFTSIPTVDVAIHNDNLVALANLFASQATSAPGAALQLIEAGASNITATGCNVNILLGFTSNTFSGAAGDFPLVGIQTIIANIASGMLFDVTAIGNYK